VAINSALLVFQQLTMMKLSPAKEELRKLRGGRLTDV
jgi:hypothetical protein